MGPKLSDEILVEELDDDAYSLFRDEYEEDDGGYPSDDYDYDELVEDEY